MDKPILLRTQQLKVAYGGILAVKGIDLEIYEGELVSLIGSNGAGKSTTLMAVSGLLPLAGGSVEILGQTLSPQMGAWNLVKSGLSLVPEGRGTFTRMSVLENLLMGAYLRSDKADIQGDIDRAFTIFPRLAERKKQLAGTLSGGEQQMLAMARALMNRPKLLLLDEPSMGLSPILVDTIFQVIEAVSKQGVTILVVEQNASRALEISSRSYVMDTGHISLSGCSGDLLKNPLVQQAYLGV
ncbi:MAG: ABC transporter ATP-binding protein [Gammaproteobacteria bacterium]|nr:ABC transporter ATP-binding protein [Gammaproteobacteria bacterium]